MWGDFLALGRFIGQGLMPENRFIFSRRRGWAAQTRLDPGSKTKLNKGSGQVKTMG